MRTATVFRKAGLPQRAAAIDQGGRSWLELHRAMVLSWAEQYRLTEAVERALAVDLLEIPFCVPRVPFQVDVIIPFCQADFRYVSETVESIRRQRFVTPTIHVISDGAPWPELPINLKRYETPGQWGPYRITNAVFRNVTSPYMAIQDADDISHPDRLWRQIARLEESGAEMISSAMTQFVDDSAAGDPELERRVQGETVVRPGVVFDTVPRGRCVNSMRTLTAELFGRLNGFAEMFCTGDFDFDNRARFSGADVVDDQEILGRRRIHRASLTNGPFKMGTENRTRDVNVVKYNLEQMRRYPNQVTARELGALHRSQSIERVGP